MRVFAFGSNLDPAQMRRRCCSARFVETATLTGYRLSFAGYSLRWRGGVATVIPHDDGRVPGVIWSVSAHDLDRLDGFEGVPYTYERIAASPSRRKRNAEPIWLYIHRDGDAITPPSASYVDAIRRGYRHFGLPHQTLTGALRRTWRETHKRLEEEIMS